MPGVRLLLSGLEIDMLSQPFVKQVMPEFAEELRTLLEQDNEVGLAEQVSNLRIVDRCRCEENSCATFYTVPKPKGAWGAGHENIVLDVAEGMLVLDVVDKKIVCVEVLDRDDVRQKLVKQIP